MCPPPGGWAPGRRQDRLLREEHPRVRLPFGWKGIHNPTPCLVASFHPLCHPHTLGAPAHPGSRRWVSVWAPGQGMRHGRLSVPGNSPSHSPLGPRSPLGLGPGPWRPERCLLSVYVHTAPHLGLSALLCEVASWTVTPGEGCLPPRGTPAQPPHSRNTAPTQAWRRRKTSWALKMGVGQPETWMGGGASWLSCHHHVSLSPPTGHQALE